MEPTASVVLQALMVLSEPLALPLLAQERPEPVRSPVSRVSLVEQVPLVPRVALERWVALQVQVLPVLPALTAMPETMALQASPGMLAVRVQPVWLVPLEPLALTASRAVSVQSDRSERTAEFRESMASAEWQ